MLKRAISLLLLALPLFFSVPQAEGRTPGPMFQVATGKATFYSDSFHGKKTANGERYDKHAFTAAHRSLPLGTIVRVTNLSNGRNLLVRINDRGPVKKKLILDVSKAAAHRLNMIRRGVIPVQVEVVADKRGVPVHRGSAFYLKLAEAKSLREGHRKAAALAPGRAGKAHPRQPAPSVTGEIRLLSEKAPDGRTRYFVGQGPFTRYGDAVSALRKAKSRHREASLACLPVTVAENTR